jgi:hypothetical protein
MLVDEVIDRPEDTVIVPTVQVDSAIKRQANGDGWPAAMASMFIAFTDFAPTPDV